jgi:hypothetical protein
MVLPSFALYSRLLRNDIMAELQLTLTSEEREYLASLLEATLKETRIEEHRTRTPTYREHVVHREEVILSLLRKLSKPQA